MAEAPARRRLAAILAADVVGYSRLMERDEAGTLAALKARRRDVLDPLVTKHHGRIFKVAGDGVLVEFASAVDAVQCAVDLQQGMAAANGGQPEDGRLVLRIGINLGDVMVEGSDLYGDGVNIAARLETIAEPGGILLSGTAHDHVKNKVKTAFDDLGAQSLKNIVEPVRAYRVADMPSIAAAAPTIATDKPSIAVLPFTNMSGDPEQEYFSDGITEDIITELSKFRTLFVIARNSSFAFKGRSFDVKAISSKLGVRYIVEGSVRRARNRIRITAQLIDAGEDKHVWAQRYDRDLEDIFAVQDEVTLAIVTAIEPQLAISERKRALRKPPESLDAWENYQRGLWHTFHYKPAERDPALGFLQRAIELDPTFAPAHAGLAYALYTYVILDASPDRQSDIRRAFEAAQTAVMLDERDPFGWVALTRVHIMRGEPDAAVTAADTAISLNPNFALAHFGRAHAMWHLGRPAEAVLSHDLAMRLSPHDAMMWAYLASKAIALVMLEEFEAAIDLARKSQQQAHAAIHSHLAEISALGHLGRGDEARDAIKRAREKKPDLSIAYVAAVLPISDPRCRGIFHDGLRKAGLSE